MRFKVKAADLIQALNVVSIVTPRPLTPQGGSSGYLFVMRRDDKGSPRGFVYSRDSNESARADFAVLELDGEGSFIAPLKSFEGLEYVPNDEVSFEIKAEGDNHSVSYTTTSDATDERLSFDPRLIAPIDKDLDGATGAKTFQVGVLRDAIGMSKRFLADAKDTRSDEHLKTLQVFDGSNEAWAKGNGTMFATNGTKAFYYYSEAFSDNGVAIHGAHLDRLVTFLSRCEGTVEIRHGERMMFAVNKITDKDGNVTNEQVFGWAHHTKTHTKYSYYPFKIEKYVLRMPKLTLLNALGYTRKKLEANRDKIRIHFDAARKEVSFHVVDTTAKSKPFPVPVIDATLAEEKDFDYNLNLDQLIELVDGVKGNEVILRVAPVPKDEKRTKDAAMFRTIDEFWVDKDGKVIGGSGSEKDEAGNEKRPDGGIKCRVTRFMPSKD